MRVKYSIVVLINIFILLCLSFVIYHLCKDPWQAGAPPSGRKTHPPWISLWISVDSLDSMIFLPTIVVGNQHFATVWGTNMNYEKARFTWYPIWHLSRYAIIICCAIRRLNRKGNPLRYTLGTRIPPENRGITSAPWSVRKKVNWSLVHGFFLAWRSKFFLEFQKWMFPKIVVPPNHPF